MQLSQKSKYRLLLEKSACCIGAVLGLPAMLDQSAAVTLRLLGMVLFVPAVLYLQRLNKELKSRREPLTPPQKQLVFGSIAGPLGLVWLLILVLAWWRETSLLWILFVLFSLYVAVGLFCAHGDIYKDGPSA